VKHEFHAEYPFALQDGVVQAFAIEWLAGKSGRLPHRWREIAAVQDPIQRISILSQAIGTIYREQARMGTRKEAGGLRFWIQERSSAFLRNRLKMMNEMGLSPALPDLTSLPPGSWSIRFTFTLRKPYISKDDLDFYILDNPVKKEWVFKVPYVAPSQWKGALRAAMRRLRGYTTWEEEMRDQQMIRLFGNVKGEENEFGAGRLHFYPTFFDQIGLEVINPHDRGTGAGKQPIYFECVPTGARGTFTLLYVPLTGPDEAGRQAVEDLQAVAQGIEAMMTRYGFGAKTSSGYGVVETEFVKDEEGKALAIIRVREGRAFRCRSFVGLRQAAAKLAEELGDGP